MTAVTDSSDFFVSSDPNDALLFSVQYVFCILKPYSCRHAGDSEFSITLMVLENRNAVLKCLSKVFLYVFRTELESCLYCM